MDDNRITSIEQLKTLALASQKNGIELEVLAKFGVSRIWITI